MPFGGGQIGLPWWLSWQRIRLQCKRPRFDPWVRKIPWRREWPPTPVILPGESYGQRGLAGYSPWGHKESDVTEQLNTEGHNYYCLSDSKLELFLFCSEHPLLGRQLPVPPTPAPTPNRSTLLCSPVVTWEDGKSCIFDVSTLKKLL